MSRFLLVTALGFGCNKTIEEKPDDSDDVCSPDVSKRVAVISSLNFARRDENNQTPGFDLDGYNTSIGDSTGCGIADLLSPEGHAGIDSAFSGLLPTLEATQAVAINGLIEDSIKSGELILMLELNQLEDFNNDPCANFEISRGEGIPLIGTDGELLPAQSFGRSNLPQSGVNGVSLSDGAFTATGFEYQLPIQILDVFVDIRMKDIHLFGQWNQNDTISGYFGGAVPIDDLRGITELNDIGDVGNLLDGLLAAAADMDLDQDGTCDAISLVFSYEGIGAYFYDE